MYNKLHVFRIMMSDDIGKLLIGIDKVLVYSMQREK